ncbi:WD40-like beta Propeller [Candidatus Koribacter versatilis Ellin345]|uniref:WD40-like beta Propeller n=1 Tax=Koribacter versatilis (strain Ellin345) TaxID=204669 RepID=Q1IJL7_KORVE|nr:LpqB family beta-propeller domain-containing protein [Candidatus Koribacter versatilis]ABF42933.1 WD40-like beta Propeller [Candidatus Koribacter versatilis Ellin345]
MKRKLLFLVSALIAVGTLALAQSGPLGIAYQFTHTQNMDPTFSPDGKEMIYISVVAGKEQLFRVGLDGKNPLQLTRDDADHEDPAWSPDGKHVAFVLIHEKVEQIHLMDPDGGNVTPLTPKESKTIHPSWSPDSRRVIFCTDDDLAPPKKNDSDILAMDIATHETTKLISGGVNTFPVWSPDGTKLAFRRMLGERNSEVFLANENGSDPKNLTNDPAFDGWPAWSPDGKQIAFASNRRGNHEIFVMNADGSGVRKAANSEGRATSPKWSKDGKKLYFTNCKKVDLGIDCEIYAIDVPR